MTTCWVKLLWVQLGQAQIKHGTFCSPAVWCEGQTFTLSGPLRTRGEGILQVAEGEERPCEVVWGTQCSTQSDIW